MHESFLTVFFEQMNDNFKNKWCVLHSYETLPYYSESDVDMAFSGTDIYALEKLILAVANLTGWCLYQKLWYDVETCFYYVLKQNGSNVFLALDFLMDNNGLGKYGFKTSVLTSECIMTSNKFPIPNPEVAFSYKLVKRIVKKRSLLADKNYLMEQYSLSDSNKLDLFLTNQFGNLGNEMITKFLTIKEHMLAKTDIHYLNNNRRKLTANFQNEVRILLWQIRRVFDRIFHPSGMIIYVPELKEEQLELFKNEMSDRLDILFRFIIVNPANSLKVNLTSFVGSTLVICPLKKNSKKKSINYNWFSRKRLDMKLDGFDNENTIKLMADSYSDSILEVLSKRLSNRIVSEK